MTSITATLTAIPNGTIVDLDAQSNLSWMRVRGNNPWNYSAWGSDFLVEPWGFAPLSTVIGSTEQERATFNALTGEERNAALRDPATQFLIFGSVPLPADRPVLSCGGRLFISVSPAGDHPGQISATDSPGLVGHTFLSGRRLNDEVATDTIPVYPAIAPPSPLMRVDAAPAAYAMTSAITDVIGVELAVRFRGQASPVEADFYFWFRSGIQFSWALETVHGTVGGLSYSAPTHGPMVANQLYRLRGSFPASSADVCSLRLSAGYDTSTGAPAKVCFGCVTLRTT